MSDISKGVLEFNGLKQVEYNGNFEEKAMFAKKAGGEWGLGKGNVDWSQFQPRTKLYVTWANWTVMSATSNLPAAGGGGKPGYKPPPYHPQQYVSNMVGQCIARGLIEKPEDMHQWAVAAAKDIKAVTGYLEGKEAPSPSQAPQSVGGEPFNDPIPF